MKAEIFSIGTEFLMGEMVDTNAPYLAERLVSLGIPLMGLRQLGDDLDALVRAFRESSAELILATGGLGPTPDDLTREAIAAFMGQRLEEDPALRQELEERFRGRNTTVTPQQYKQAMLIPSARPLPNSHGTAPGWWVEDKGRIVVAMPGPPNEMQPMWENKVAPLLAQREEGQAIYSRTIKTFGMSEAAVAERIAHLFRSQNPFLGIYAKADGIHLRFIATAATEEETRALVGPLEQKVRSALGDVIWGADEDTLEGRLGELLRHRGMALATMESCTGGLLASTITDVPGSSDYYKGGVVAYTKKAKMDHGVDYNLILEYGVISSQVAEEMAQAARHEFGADLGIGITGVAGPGEVEGKPAGTVYIAVAYPGGVRHEEMRFARQRAIVKRRAVSQALFAAVRVLTADKPAGR